MLHFALTTAAKDIARWRQDSVAMLLWLGIPFLVGGLLTLLMGGGNLQPRGTLLIADQDQTFLSAAVAGAFSQGELSELIITEAVSVAEGKTRIDNGEASAFLVVPAGFSSALLRNEPMTLALLTNPSQQILPAIMRDVLEILMDAGFYAQQLFATEIETAVANDSPDNLLVAEIAVRINEKIQAVGSHLFPAAFDLQIVEPPAEAPQPPLALLFLPGIVLMALVFAANGLAADYWNEREQGTLRRLFHAPIGLSAFLVGKATAVAVIMAILAGITLLAGFVYHDVSFLKLPTMLGFSILAGVALFAWFGFVQMLAGSRRSANLLTTIMLFPLLMVGGSFFPLATLPDWIAALGRLTPNGFVSDQLTLSLTASDTANIDLSSWLTIVALSVFGFLLCGWRLRAGFARA